MPKPRSSPYVTKFFNGNSEIQFEGEDRVLYFPKVERYSEMPEMSAYKVTEECIKRIQSGEYDFMVLNFATRYGRAYGRV